MKRTGSLEVCICQERTQFKGVYNETIHHQDDFHGLFDNFNGSTGA